MNEYSWNSGNPIVDQVGQMELIGNIIPHSWYKTLIKEDGKPYTNAILVLADIVYWYRPMEVIDSESGVIKGIKPRFGADLLQRNYQQLTDRLGLTKNQAQKALEFLENKKIIKRHLRTVETSTYKIGNVLFIELFPDELKKITYPLLQKNDKVAAQKNIPKKKKNTTKTKNKTKITSLSINQNYDIEAIERDLMFV